MNISLKIDTAPFVVALKKYVFPSSNVLSISTVIASLVNEIIGSLLIATADASFVVVISYFSI